MGKKGFPDGEIGMSEGIEVRRKKAHPYVCK